MNTHPPRQLDPGDTPGKAIKAPLPARKASSALRRLARTAFLVVLAAAAAHAAAQPSFDTLAIEDGLPQSQVRALCQDERGCLWVGTLGGGLSRFDGRGFETLTTRQGLRDDRVHTLARDARGWLWIGTERGLTIHDGQALRPPPAGLDRPGAVRAVLPLPTEVFVGSDEGLLHQAPSPGGPTRKPPELAGVRVRALIQDRAGRVWIGTSGRGLARWEQGRVSFVEATAGLDVTALLATRQGPIWAATDRGVYATDGNAVPAALLGPGAPRIDALLEDADGTVWLGTTGSGLCRYAQARLTCFGKDDGLGSNTVWALARDHEGSLWAGTYRGGLSRFLGGERIPPVLRAELSGVVVRALLEDRRGRLWFATDDRGALVYDGGSVRWLRKAQGLAHDFVLTLFEDRRGAVWLGTFGGLSRYDGGAVRSYTSADGLGDNVVRAVVEDGDGTLWAGTNEGGVARFDGRRFRTLGAAQGLNANAVNTLYVDRRGRLWAGTARGLSLFGDGRFADASSRLGLSVGSIYAIREDAATGDLWLGVFGEGIVRVPLDLTVHPGAPGMRAQSWRGPGVLGSDKVVSLAFDSGGDLWVGTEAGVDRLRLDRRDPGRLPAVEAFGDARGRGRIEPIHNAALSDRSGRVWFGTLRGPRLFDPDRDTGRRAEPRVRIRALGPAVGDWSWTQRLPADEPFSVPPDQNRLAVAVEAVSLKAASRLRYQFRLRGWSDDWSAATPNPEVFYPGLPAGEYALSARASADGASWVEAPGPVRFRVLLPFWRRGWFLAASIALGALVVYAGHRLSVARLTSHERELQQAVAVRERAEQELRRINRALRLLGECSQALVRASDERGLLHDVCRLIVEAGGYRLAWVGYAEHDAARSVRPVASAGFDEGYVALADVTWGEDERGLGPTGSAIRSGKPAIVHDMLTHPGYERWRRDALRHGYAASIALPLQRDGQLLGALNVYAAERDAFGEREVELLGELANDLAYGIGAQRARADRERAEQALRASEQTLRGLVNATSDVVFLLDPAGVILALNERAARTLGGGMTELLGRNVLDMLPADLQEAWRLRLREAGESGRPLRFEDQREGHWRDHIVTPLLDGAGGAHRIAVFSRDVTARKQAEAKLQHDALHDALTGLPNRALLVERLEWSIRRAARNPERRFAVLFLDLDGFKLVNDSLGHEAGDRLLVALAPRLVGCLRASDTCARLGGDEFVMLLDEAREERDAAEVAERIQRRLREPFEIEGRTLTLSGSIGIVIGGGGYTRADEVLRDVDIAMYRAKEQGRSRHEVFDVEMRASAMARVELEGSLVLAAERGELRVAYQPIYALATGALQGFEALVRWQHPERGLLAPASFVPLAESGPLIGAIDGYVLREACRQLREWQRGLALARGLTVHVNSSARLLSSGALAAQVEAVLRETGLAAGALQIEITESALMGNMATAAETLRHLRALGVRVAIDDFGVGYSSLAYLVQLPVDTLKIDRAFVSHLGEPGGRDQIVETIVAMGQKLGLELVAEGVESEAQRERLRALGCQSAQGYLFSRPLQASDAETLIADGGAAQRAGRELPALVEAQPETAPPEAARQTARQETAQLREG